jgi:hypothetical protein
MNPYPLSAWMDGNVISILYVDEKRTYGYPLRMMVTSHSKQESAGYWK